MSESKVLVYSTHDYGLPLNILSLPKSPSSGSFYHGGQNAFSFFASIGDSLNNGFSDVRVVRILAHAPKLIV